jgi:hypothetical protein
MKPVFVGKLSLLLVLLALAAVYGPFRFSVLVAEAVSSSRGSSSPFFPNRGGSRSWGPPHHNFLPSSSICQDDDATVNRHAKLIASLQTKSSLVSNDDNSDDIVFPRGGQVEVTAIPNNVVRVVGTLTNILIQCGNVVLPPVVAVISLVVHFYRALPKDALVAQVGLVYCFAGGYYPTLFSSLAAARQFGWHIAVAACQDLVVEALAVIRALEEHEAKTSSAASFFSSSSDQKSRALLFRQKTGVVLATVDPVKINQAAGALYTTWLGVSSVLEKEYARVITLSLTMAGVCLLCI